MHAATVRTGLPHLTAAMPINTPPQKPTIRATIHDVALEAGVSIKTVSRVVNGERHVRPSVEARVFEAIARLGYQPNEVARSLKGSRSRTIGLIIADISNPFYATCAKAVEEVARSHGFAVILCTSNENVENEEAYIDLLSRRRVDGLLLVPTAEDHDHLRRMRSYGLPVVALDRPVEETATDSVVAQNQVGVRLAIEHLIGHGHKRIAFVGADEHLYTVRTRLAGYHEAIRAAGLEEICRFGAPNTESAA